jgi:hypothetical protein
VLLVPAALFVVPWWLHPTDRSSGGGGDEAIVLPATEATEWQGGIASGTLVGMAAGLAVLGALILLVLPGPSLALRILLVVVLLGGAVFALALARIRVTVDAEALRVRSAVLPLPLRTIRTERIRAVEAAVIEPMHWGGWGYRSLPGHAAIVLRRTGGIVVTTREGSRFAVTVDDAGTGAAVLAGIVERARQHAA